MNEVKLFENEEFGFVRTVMIDGEPWFCLLDVCRSLEISNTGQAKTRLKQDGIIGNDIVDAAGRKQKVNFVNEPNLYKLIFQSRKDSAEKFSDWVTSEILPTIRKTGSYSISAKPDSYTIEDPVERAKRWIEEQEEKKSLESKVSEMSPKAELCDKLLDAKLLVNFRDAAKEIGISQSQLTGWLKDNGYVYSNSAGELRPMEPYMESGLFEMKPYQNPHNGYKSSRTYITGRGLAAFKTLIDDSGHSRYTMKKHGGRKKK